VKEGLLGRKTTLNRRSWPHEAPMQGTMQENEVAIAKTGFVKNRAGTKTGKSGDFAHDQRGGTAPQNLGRGGKGRLTYAWDWGAISHLFRGVRIEKKK